MKKYVYIIFILLTTKVSFAQMPVILNRVTKKVIEKIIPRAVERNVGIYLTQSEVERLAKAYPFYSEKISSQNGVYYYKGVVYGYPKNLFGENNSESAKIMAEAAKAFSKADYSSLATNIKIDYTDVIKMIQFDLISSGYLLKLDGIMGKETKNAIADFYDVNCDLYTIDQIVHIVYNLATHNKRWPADPEFKLKTQAIRSFDLRIGNANGEVKYFKDLPEASLNKMLEEFKCSVDEVCLSIAKLAESSLSFACKDALGNSVTINLSSNNCKVDIGFKHNKYKSSKLSFGTDGKVKLSTTRNL